MKLRLPFPFLSAVLAAYVMASPCAFAVEVPEGYTSNYLADPDELYDYRTSSSNLAFLLDGSVSFSSSTATWWQSEVLKSSGSILFTIEEDGDPYSLTFKDASYQAFDVNTLRIEDIGKVSFSGIKTTMSGFNNPVIKATTIRFMRNREVSISNNHQTSNNGGYYLNGGAIITNSTLDINENTRGVTISGNSTTHALSSGGSSNSIGGAIYGLNDSSISLNGNAGGLTISGNYASASSSYSYISDPSCYSYSYGGAIYGERGSCITLDGNAGGLSISGNHAISVSDACSSSSSSSYTARSTSYAYGGAIYGKSSTSISLNGNTGDLIITGNYASSASQATKYNGSTDSTRAFAYSYGGAIYGGSGSSLSISGNTGTVSVSGNAVIATATARTISTTALGGAIYSEGSIAIQNNGDVLFTGNYEQSQDTYRLRSIYLTNSTSDGGYFHLSAAAGKSITFEDSVYVATTYSGQTVDVVFNGSYTDASESTIAQEGDIIFDGGKAAEVLQGLKADASDEEILNSQNSYIGGLINLQAGRLVVRNGAHLNGLGVSTKARSGAALVLEDGYMDHGSASINLRRGTSLELSGENSITADALSFSSGSTLQFTAGEAQRETAVLNLDATLEHFSINVAVNGDGMLASGRYKLLQLADAAQYDDADGNWNADDITVTATGDAAGLGFNDLVWEDGVLYVVQGKTIWSNRSGNGVWNGESANWLRNGVELTYRDGMDVQFDDTAAGTVQLEGKISPLSVVVDNSTGHDYTFAGSGSLSGETSLEKSGNGVLNLATANEHTGGTYVNEGVLNVQHSRALGAAEAVVVTAAGSQLNIENNAAVVLAAAEGNDLAGQVSVAAGASLEVKGTGYHAEATKLAGELIFSGEGVNHTGNGAGSLSGSGILKVQGAGTAVRFGSAADFTGSVALANGAEFAADVLEVQAGASLMALAAGAQVGLEDMLPSGAAQVEMHTTQFVYRGRLNAEMATNTYTAGTTLLEEGLVLQGGASYQAECSSVDLGGCTLAMNAGGENPFITLNLVLDGTYTPGETQIVLFTGVSSFVLNGVEFGGSDTAFVFAASDYLKGDYVVETTALVYDGNVGCVYLTEALPEPTTTTLSLLALAALAARRRRK